MQNFSAWCVAIRCWYGPFMSNLWCPFLFQQLQSGVWGWHIVSTYGINTSFARLASPKGTSRCTTRSLKQQLALVLRGMKTNNNAQCPLNPDFLNTINRPEGNCKRIQRWTDWWRSVHRWTNLVFDQTIYQRTNSHNGMVHLVKYMNGKRWNIPA